MALMSAKSFFLLLLVAQNTSKTLILRLAVGGKGQFLYSAAVLATEGLKATSSAVWVLHSGGTPATIVHFLRSEWRVFVRVLNSTRKLLAIFDVDHHGKRVGMQELADHLF